MFPGFRYCVPIIFIVSVFPGCIVNGSCVMFSGWLFIVIVVICCCVVPLFASFIVITGLLSS